MDTFLLTSPADRHSHAFGSRKTACPGSIHLLVDKHNVGGTEVMHQQATGVKNQKNSEQNTRYLLTIPTSGTQKASSKQPASKTKKIVSKMLTNCSLFQPVEHLWSSLLTASAASRP